MGLLSIITPFPQCRQKYIVYVSSVNVKHVLFLKLNTKDSYYSTRVRLFLLGDPSNARNEGAKKFLMAIPFLINVHIFAR